MRDKVVTLDDLKAYTELTQHIREHMDDYDMDDVEKKRFELFIYNADREVNALLDRAELWRQKSRTLLQVLQMYWSCQRGQNDIAQEDRSDGR